MRPKKRIGIDVDGVLANFNKAFVERITKVTGRKLFPSEWYEDANKIAPPCWEYDKHFGYTAAESTETWLSIMADERFWVSLSAYSDNLLEFRNFVWNMDTYRLDDVYFITNRPGPTAKKQTEDWLEDMGFHSPTVLICQHKGYMAKALELDCFLDDYHKNVMDVENVSRWTNAYLLDAPYNQGDFRVGLTNIVKDVKEFLVYEGLGGRRDGCESAE